jgi:hypothetical protein
MQAGEDHELVPRQQVIDPAVCDEVGVAGVVMVAPRGTQHEDPRDLTRRSRVRPEDAARGVA